MTNAILQWGRRVNTAEWPTLLLLTVSRSTLQWGRRVNTAECETTRHINHTVAEPSMGPPREHGGMGCLTPSLPATSPPSMGPPREHGGMAAFDARAFSRLPAFNGAAA